MKKIFIGFALLAVLVGVSYVKSLRGQSARKEAFREGEQQSQRRLDAGEEAQDSLKRYLAERELQFADSMTTFHTEYRSTLDSLEGLSKKQDQTIDRLENELAKARSPRSAQKTDEPQEKFEKEVIVYYESKYDLLPKDLTEYERRVALNELREETATHFSISLDELKSIRTKYKLSY